MTESKQYLLKVTANQARALSKACELFSRLSLGQWGELAHMVRCGEIKGRDGTSPNMDDIDDAESLLNQAKKFCTGLPSNASHGIHSTLVSEGAKICWDLYTAIRNRLSWERAGNPEKRRWTTGDGEPSMFGVNYDEPHTTSQEPTAVVENADTMNAVRDLPYGYAIARHKSAGGQAEWHLMRINGVSVEWVARGESPESMLRRAVEAQQTSQDLKDGE